MWTTFEKTVFDQARTWWHKDGWQILRCSTPEEWGSNNHIIKEYWKWYLNETE